ncbi:phosphatase PAP2 family protein [Chryseobacterium culicis]|nr:phosphatase PAP2 family protein [Chryseobacterium culicis]
MNSKLSQFPYLQYNINQLGDTVILLSIISIFILYIPKIWESLLSGIIISGCISTILKKIFSIPRPAAILDRDSFIIIGETLSGSNSLPSGHSVTIFTVLTILLFAFSPQRIGYKCIYFFTSITVGLIAAFTRVAVGAHYPLDVIFGAILGYICGLLGIFISQKTRIWFWINNKNSYPIFISIFLILCTLLVIKILQEGLIIFYITLNCLLITVYKIILRYVKK